MLSKEKIAQALFSGIERGKISAHAAFSAAGKLDPFFSRKMSRAGKFLRKNQLEFVLSALDPKNRRAWISVFFPAELLNAFGILPLSLEVLSGLLSTCGLSKRFLSMSLARGVPVTMCSFHRVLSGLATSGYFAPPDIIASTSLFCDGNLKSFSDAAGSCKAPFFFLDVPCEMNEGSVEYVRSQLMEMAGGIESATGIKFCREKFTEAVAHADSALKLLRKIYEIRKSSDHFSFRGYELANLCFPSHYFLGNEGLIKIADAIIGTLNDPGDLNRAFEKRPANARPKRLMWMHIVPQYDTSLWGMIDDGVKARIVCDEYTAPYFDGYDLNDPFGSVARRLISHPSNGPLERRIASAIRTAKDFDVDGVMHFSSWGCHQASGNVHIMEKAFENEGIKFLNLNGDAVDRDNTTFGQHKTRIEAFLERMI